MGEIRNFQVNKDGSVTMNEPSKNSESTIIDILRIEHAKGGVFSSLRMKKRAIKYAETTGIPNSNLVVEKIILERYPNSFKNISLAQKLKFLLIIFSVFEIALFSLIFFSHHRDQIYLIILGCIILTLPFLYLGRTIYRNIKQNQLKEILPSNVISIPTTKSTEELRGKK